MKERQMLPMQEWLMCEMNDQTPAVAEFVSALFPETDSPKSNRLFLGER